MTTGPTPRWCAGPTAPAPIPVEATLYTNGGYDLASSASRRRPACGISAAASIGSSKYVRGQLDSVFHRDPQVGATVQGGLISYQMQLTNTGNVDFQNLRDD